MMGLCNSCFGKKYLGRSPPEADCYLEADAEKLIAGSSPKISVFSGGGGGEANKIEKLLEKSEASDSGTCIDEFCDKRGGADAFPEGKDVEPLADNNEEEDEAKDADEDNSCAVAAKENGICYGLELENVQVTLSSVGSLGGILEEVPELDAEEEEESSCRQLLFPPQQQEEAELSLASSVVDEDAPLLPESAQRRSTTPTASVTMVGGLKPTSEDRHPSFGSKKSILSSVMAEGNYTANNIKIMLKL